MYGRPELRSLTSHPRQRAKTLAILTRYLIRAHVGPFLFAFSAITGLLFLNAVAQRLEDLAGKGLPWTTILEFMALSLPHTVALTFPMATLVAVLYAFSELTAANEVTAMKAGGVRPQRLLLPLLGVGIILAEVMFVFNDQVLPETNHRLKNLLIEVGRKSPTFQLREQVVNEIAAGNGQDPVFLTASSIDQQTNELEDVVIYDAEETGAHRTTHARRGTMAFNASRTDLFLTLYDGVVLETDPEREGGFRQLYFTRQVVPLRDVGNELEARAAGSDRGDREMSVAMLQDEVDERFEQLAEVAERNRRTTRETVLQALGRPPEEDGARPARSTGVPTADPAASALAMPLAAAPPQLGASGSARSSRRIERDDVTQRAALTARTSASHAEALRGSIDRFRVEIHKKYTLSFACIVFVLLGAPLALRYPRGGLGLVIAASSAIFAVYWMGLIGGESLADRGVAPPAVTMWAPNLIFLTVALVLVQRMGREAATMRGGGWDDLLWSARTSVARLARRRAA